MGINLTKEFEVDGGGTGTPEENTTPTFDFEEAVRSPYGLSELNNYLYDSKLQNIFKDYKENIATLNKQEQTNLQYAYYIREMSKKYLGEYASNHGINNVSGDLMSIYSDYQKNLGEIKANYDTLEMNLTQEYRNQKMTMFNEKMKSQYDMAITDFSTKSQEIMFNASIGKYDTNLYNNGFEYLDDMFAKKEMSQEDYIKAYGTLRETTISQIETNLYNKNYGDFDTAEEYIASFGNIFDDSTIDMLTGVATSIVKEQATSQIMSDISERNWGEYNDGFEYLDAHRDEMGDELYWSERSKVYTNALVEIGNELLQQDDPEAYLETWRGKISDTDLAEFKEGLEDYQSYQETLDEYEIMSPQIKDDEGNLIDNPNYIGDDYDFSMNVPYADVGRDSYSYQDSQGNRYFAVRGAADDEGEDSPYYKNTQDLFEEWNNSERSGYTGLPPINGDRLISIVDVNKSIPILDEDGNQVEENGELQWEERSTTEQAEFVFQNGSWHRLAQEQIPTNTDMQFWFQDTANQRKDDKTTTGEDFEITRGSKRNYETGNQITVYGNNYVQNDTPIFDITSSSLSDEYKAVVDKFKEVAPYGSVYGAKSGQFVYVNGKMYYHWEGKVYEMNKK